MQPDELVVAESHLQIRQHLIRLIDVLEFILCLPVSMLRLLLQLLAFAVDDVRVVQFGLAEELLLDLLLGRRSRHTQDLVVVLVQRELQLGRE